MSSIHSMSDDQFADFDRDPADLHNPEPSFEEMDAGLARWLDPDNEDNYDDSCDLVGVPDDDIPDWAYDDDDESDDFEASQDF
jgi:hypothetical protein